MSAISKCKDCEKEFHISDYNGVKCVVCGNKFCDPRDGNNTI